MNSRIASKFAVYPAPSNTVELALHAPPPPRAAPSRSSGPRPSTYLVCLERMPAEPDQARACSRRRSVPGRRRWASPQDLAFVRALDQPEHRHLAVLVEQVFRDPRHAAQQCFKRYFGHRRREERKPVGPIGSWGAGTNENTRQNTQENIKKYSNTRASTTTSPCGTGTSCAPRCPALLCQKILKYPRFDDDLAACNRGLVLSHRTECSACNATFQNTRIVTGNARIVTGNRRARRASRPVFGGSVPRARSGARQDADAASRSGPPA
jgi:hypothetical protein